VGYLFPSSAGEIVVNTHKKGQSKELLCQKELEANGWNVVFRSYTIKMGPIFKGIDFADLFDVVAIKDFTWRFISVKNDGKMRKEGNAHILDIKNFREKHMAPAHSSCVGFSTELWIWFPPGWKGRGKNKKFEPAHWIKTTI